MATATLPDLDVEQPGFGLEKYYEIVDGQVVEEPPLGALENRLAARLVRSLILFDPSGSFGEAYEETLFILRHSPSLRRRPDVAFVTQERWPLNRPVPREAAWDVIPDIAVEITSPTDLIDDLMDKIDEYFEAGVRLVWVIYPKHRKIYAYGSLANVRILQECEELDGGPVLPGFRVPLSRLFEVQEDGPSPMA